MYILYRKFGRACISRLSINRLYGSYGSWKCLKCHYKDITKSRIIKMVNPEINNILNKANLNKYHSLFKCISLNELLSFEKSDLIELGISKQDSQILWKYIFDNYKTNYNREMYVILFYIFLFIEIE